MCNLSHRTEKLSLLKIEGLVPGASLDVYTSISLVGFGEEVERKRGCCRIEDLIAG